jgi:hypothetical protein
MTKKRNEIDDPIGALALRLNAAFRRQNGADWTDVLSRSTRARRRRRGIYGAVLLAALVVIGVASAYALGHPIVDFNTAEKGSTKIVDDFGSMDIGAPPGMAPGVRAEQARRIPGLYLNGKKFNFWVAPTKKGGFCEISGCIADRRTLVGHIAVTVSGNKGNTGVAWINGDFIDGRGERLELSYADGSRDEIPFVWVNAPINAGFFVFGIPKEHQVPARRPVTIALFDGEGTTLAREPIDGAFPDALRMTVHHLPGYPDLDVPAKAIWAKRQQLFDWRADDGKRVGLWVAPERGGGTCMWSSQGFECSRVGGRTRNLPAGIVQLGFQGGGTHVNVSGSVGRRVARVEARFRDGDRIELRPKEGYLIWPIPSRHYPRGHRLYALVAFDDSGRVIARQRMLTNSPALYPCAKPRLYRYGVRMCP